jgi:hypothetical protein
MLFYHYTCPTNVMLIAEQGLLPNASDDNGFMTDNMPVVWLTRQQTNITTAAQAAHYKKLGVDMPGTKEGDETFGGAARLNVRLEPQKRLMKYSDFLRKNVPAAVAATRAHLTLTAWENWYVFLGIIPACRIDATLPATLALECLDHHIATHPDPDACERFKAFRAEAATVPPDAPVSFGAGTAISRRTAPNG